MCRISRIMSRRPRRRDSGPARLSESSSSLKESSALFDPARLASSKVFPFFPYTACAWGTTPSRRGHGSKSRFPVRPPVTSQGPGKNRFPVGSHPLPGDRGRAIFPLTRRADGGARLGFAQSWSGRPCSGDRRSLRRCGRDAQVIASLKCSSFLAGSLFGNHYPRFKGALSQPFSTASLPSPRWIRAKVEEPGSPTVIREVCASGASTSTFPRMESSRVRISSTMPRAWLAKESPNCKLSHLR